MEIFVYTEFALDLSTLFTGGSVEKPVENVENSCVKSVSPGLQYKLCQLVIVFAGFYMKDICFHCE